MSIYGRIWRLGRTKSSYNAMSEFMEKNTSVGVLFVNGVNTNFGGASVRLNQAWYRSMSDAGCEPDIINSVPTFGIKYNGHILKALLAIYFLPGTLFRIFRFPVFEFLFKLSPIFLICFLVRIIYRRPRLVLLSHHSMFLYGLLLRRHRRVYVVHDLLYIRARSMQYPKFISKMLFRIECAFYGTASQVLVLSQAERRLLSRFLRLPVVLVSCLCAGQRHGSFDETSSSHIAVVSDWRRPENLHGLLTFFKEASPCSMPIDPTAFVIYGLGSKSAAQAVAGLPAAAKFTFIDSGSYQDLSDIREKFFLVPTYRGAGIKTKVLEAFDAGRFVVGTRAAFIGLKRAPLKDISLVVKKPEDIVFSHVSGSEIQAVFRHYYTAHFSDFGSVVRDLLIH